MSTFRRDEALDRLGRDQFDVLVIGGGITGAGAALEAASRGLRTALVDKEDFGSGTSSKSSKLIHGGLRYLQQRELRLVYENLAERQRLLDNAPHLVSPLPFLIPLFGREGVVSKAVTRSYSSALWIYDLTGGARIGTLHRRVDREAALHHMPLLRADRLVAGFLYFDARADDARLTLEIVRTAVLDYGAVAANYAGVTRLRTEAGRVVGALLQPVPSGHTGPDAGGLATPKPIEVRARSVLNATGVWADAVAALDEGGEQSSVAGDGRHPTLRPAKGVHVTVPASRLPCDIAAVIPVPEDKRSIFVVPWPDEELVYLGTTDTAYDGPLDDPRCRPEDVDYLLSAVNRATTAALRPEDVTAVWAGLRPLLSPPEGQRVSERTADLSRRHTVQSAPSGLVSVTGGKLTTYRKMAEDAIDRVVANLGDVPSRARRSRTRHLRLHGAPRPDDRTGLRPGVPAAVQTYLRARHGRDADAVLAIGVERPELLEPIVEGLPYLGAEVLYAVREEMAQSVDDVLARRTRAVIQDAHRAAGAARSVADLMAPELGWSPQEAAAYAESFARWVNGEMAAAGLAAGEPAAPRSQP